MLPCDIRVQESLNPHSPIPQGLRVVAVYRLRHRAKMTPHQKASSLFVFT